MRTYVLSKVRDDLTNKEIHSCCHQPSQHHLKMATILKNDHRARKLLESTSFNLQCAVGSGPWAVGSGWAVSCGLWAVGCGSFSALSTALTLNMSSAQQIY